MNRIEDVYIKIGDSILNARLKKDLTQEQVAEKLRCNRTSIAKIEMGKQRVLIHDLIDICKVLDLDIKEIL